MWVYSEYGGRLGDCAWMLGVKSYGEPPEWGERKALVGSGYELLLDRAEGGAVNISLVVTISGSY